MISGYPAGRPVSYTNPVCLTVLCLVHWRCSVSAGCRVLPTPINIKSQWFTLAAPSDEVLYFLRPPGVSTASPPWRHHHLFIQHLSTPSPTPDHQTAELISSWLPFQTCWIVSLCFNIHSAKPPHPVHTITSQLYSMCMLNGTKRACLALGSNTALGIIKTGVKN